MVVNSFHSIPANPKLRNSTATGATIGIATISEPPMRIHTMLTNSKLRVRRYNGTVNNKIISA